MHRLLIPFVLLTACSGPSELIVVVDSDLSIPDELALVRASVADASGLVVAVNDFPLSEAADLPFSFVIVPLEEDTEKELTLSLIARDAARNDLFERRVATGVAAGQRLAVRICLARKCLTGACPLEQMPSKDLEEIDPGTELTQGACD